jgi:alkaline phosphatase D
MRKALLLSCLIVSFLITSDLSAQKSRDFVSGPMLGQVELRSATIWVEAKPGAAVNLWYWKKGDPSNSKKLSINTDKSASFAPVKFEIGGLDFNTAYEYSIGTSSSKPGQASGSFTTTDLWQYRKPAPDFSFLAGSCAYFNEPVFDRPGTPYGKDSSIFEAMAKEKASFMMWLGDNWYLREADYYSKWGLWYRASRDRSLPVLQNFWKAMPQYAIWDDHDYGPNDADKSYSFKEESRKVFMDYWGNPSYGENGEGIYTIMRHADVDFFMLDARYFRTNDRIQSYVYGSPNNEKRMFGEKQMEWLKNALANSRATFKIIVTGSQVLNPFSPYDCFQHFPGEYNELMGFLRAERINGVLFLTGDRHHSEIIALPRTGTYTLYDITSSPLTSGIGKVSGKEKENPSRVPGTLVEAQNYSRISIAGQRNERTLTVEFLGIKGEKLASWSINEKDLKMP